MKAIPFRIPKASETSIRIQVDEGDHFYSRLHYHPEFQITAVVKGEGLLHVGSSFAHFQDGDVFVIGGQVPHLFKSTPTYFSEDSPGVHAVSLFFHRHSFGPSFFALPELKSVRVLLDRASRGIKLAKENRDHMFQKIMSLAQSEGFSRLREFWMLLDEMAESSQLEFINSTVYALQSHEAKGDRMNRIFQYSISHMGKPISVSEIADIAHLSTSQFSRYFKLHTGKTYIQFLTEMRVESACTQLQVDDRSIEAIAHDVGFANLSNFNRQFRRLKGLTPSAYRKKTIGNTGDHLT